MSGPDLNKDKSITTSAYEDKVRDTGFKYLEGKKIKSAAINPSKDVVVLKTEEESIYLTWSGDCCAYCFLAHVEGASNLNDAQILSVEQLDWKQQSEEDYEVVETMGTKIKTSKGYVVLETRLEHNGYYSGTIEISNIAPIGNYSDYLTTPTDLKPLEDF